MDQTLRPAHPQDAEAAVPLIYSSGPAAFDFTLSEAQPFLHRAFVDGRGEFGYRNHTVAVDGDEVVGIGAAYSGDTSIGFLLAIADQILRHYGLRGLAVIVRGLRLEKVIKPPRKGVLYIAHLGVHPQGRGRGVGTRLIEHFLEEGRISGLQTAELDVAVTNPRAETLYERLGFRVVEERESSLRNEFGTVPDHRRMALNL